MGVIIGSLILGNVPTMKGSFLDVYVFPWLHPFPFMTGAFLCSLLAYTSATYLVAEAPNPRIARLFKRRAIIANIVSVIFGCIIFMYGLLTNISTLTLFFKNKYSLTLFFISSLLLVFQWDYIRKNRFKRLRVFGATQLSFIFFGWIFFQFPFVYNNKELGISLNIYEAAAPSETLDQLLIALVVGCIFIFPPYFYLLHIFKGKGSLLNK